jgi:aminopeptidase N
MLTRARLLGVALIFPLIVTAHGSRQDGTGRPANAGLLEPGIAASLARSRAARVSSVEYALHWSIPPTPQEPITARADVRFDLRDASVPLVLDFAPPSDRLRSLSSAGRPVAIDWTNGHIVVPASALVEGRNELRLEFLAGDASLNRHPDFLYTLFVPARAHLAFPCFDQPDLKARYAVTLELPAGWEAVSNGPEIARTQSGERTTVVFGKTEPLSTYLFAFAAGRFTVETAERAGRSFRMFHRESDRAKVTRNRDAIFDLHAAALSWLEAYTGIPYAFGKFDFVLIPSFQFGGMEHAGAIFYNAASLLLDQSATQNQELGRASLIAHETSHMWFGDLVTMRWFDDVWTKEVFANFMAAKIVNPSFPAINHDLRFLFSHYPAAYEVDRTPGTNAIRQQLDNLAEAGGLYGAIIYQKAPVVMRQLESLVGEESFRDGLRAYLRRYALSNATWGELIAILDDRTSLDLAAWSHAWVEEPGRPSIRTDLQLDGDRTAYLAFEQEDPLGRGLRWSQRLEVVLGYPDGELAVPVELDDRRKELADLQGRPAPLYVLPNGRGTGYGLFALDERSLAYLVRHLPDLPAALGRGSAWVTLWDALVEGRVGPAQFLDLALRALPRETDELNVQRILGTVNRAYWRFLRQPDRLSLAPRLETTLRQELDRAQGTSLKAAIFAALRDVAQTPDTLAWLERIWRRDETVPGLPLAETDEMTLALELAVRGGAGADEVLRRQAERIQDPDRKARFAFVMPALSSDPASRDRFFAGLADRANRQREAWVLEAVGYLHHPLRANRAEAYLAPSLGLLHEIQRTGDIFFPKRWMDATLSGHQSRAAADTVRSFVSRLPADYPDRLRRVILSSADELMRASAMIGE